MIISKVSPQDSSIPKVLLSWFQRILAASRGLPANTGLTVNQLLRISQQWKIPVMMLIVLDTQSPRAPSFFSFLFCICVLHTRDSPKCLENNLLPVPPPVTLAGTHHISISLRRCGPLAIASPPPWPHCPCWKQWGRHERHNQTRGIRAVAGACRMQSVIRNTAEPDPLLLRPSHRQSYTFNLLWLSVTHK